MSSLFKDLIKTIDVDSYKSWNITITDNGCRADKEGEKTLFAVNEIELREMIDNIKVATSDSHVDIKATFNSLVKEMDLAVKRCERSPEECSGMIVKIKGLRNQFDKRANDWKNNQTKEIEKKAADYVDNMVREMNLHINDINKIKRG